MHAHTYVHIITGNKGIARNKPISWPQVGEVVKGATGELTVKLIPHTDEGKPLDVTGVSTLLWAIGRDANMVNLGIDITKVELEKGFIKVDEYQNTSIPNMYALGDIAGKKLLTPGIVLSLFYPPPLLLSLSLSLHST